MHGTIWVLILLNIALAIGPPLGEATTNARRNCCVERKPGASFCCVGCCLVGDYCDSTADCRDN